MKKWLKNLLKLEHKDEQSLDDCLEDKTDRERRFREQFEKELYGLAHEKILYEGQFHVRKIVPLRLRGGNVSDYFVQANLYFDENKKNLPLTENYTDWNNFFKQHLLLPYRGFLAVEERQDIVKGDLLQIKTGCNLECGQHLGNYSRSERRKIFEALEMPPINNWEIWVPLLHSYSRISRPLLAKFIQ